MTPREGRPSIHDLVAATPATRDRYVDLLRGASILVVVLGHWLMAVLEWRGEGDGGLEATNLLAEVPALQLLTWLLQVMPVFFFVGGVANRAGISSARRRGQGWEVYLQGRVERLTRPVLPFAILWLGVAATLELAGVGGKPVRLVLRVVAQPLWFLAVYLVVVALAPLALATHERWRWRVLPVLAVAAAAIDVLQEVVPGVGWGNYPIVFCFAHQLGYFYGDGTLATWSRRRLLLAAVTGLAALVALTIGPYPASMVGVPGAGRSNMSPPTLCLVALAVWQVALVMLLRPAITPRLTGARAWGAVVAVNASIMTIFLWHLPALVVVAASLLPPGWWPQPEVATTNWWLLRPPWILLLAVVLALFTFVFGRLEQQRAELAPGHGWAAVLGVLAAGSGLTALALFGFGRVVAYGAVGLLLAGVALTGRPRTRSTAALPPPPEAP